MNLNTATGISGITAHSKMEQAVRCCDTLCCLSVLWGRGGVRTQWQDGQLAQAYEETAADCDVLIAALCGEDFRILDVERSRWFSSLKKLDSKAHTSRILILLARMGERLQNYGQDFFRIFLEQTDFPKLLKEFKSPADREIWLRNALRWVQTVCADDRQKKELGAVERAKVFMQDNFTNSELMLKTVADYIGFSEKYFSSRFIKECGCTFINYLNDLRIRRAQELLVQTDMKIYEISEAVGYSSVEHFNYKFKKKLCISPKDFRKSWK